MTSNVIGTSSCHQLICLSLAAGMPVHSLRVTKVTWGLFFYLIEIAWDHGNEPLLVFTQWQDLLTTLMNRHGQRTTYSKITPQSAELM